MGSTILSLGCLHHSIARNPQFFPALTGCSQDIGATQAKGAAQEVKGKAQQTMGKAKSTVKVAANNVADKANKKL